MRSLVEQDPMTKSFVSPVSPESRIGCGPVSPGVIEGETCFVTFVDDWSRFMVVYLMSSKDQVTDQQIQGIRSVWVGEVWKKDSAIPL